MNQPRVMNHSHDHNSLSTENTNRTETCCCPRFLLSTSMSMSKKSNTFESKNEWSLTFYSPDDVRGKSTTPRSYGGNSTNANIILACHAL